MGVRRAESPLGYTLWLTFFAALPYMANAWRTQKTALLRHATSHWPRALLAGALSVGAYAIALWAMTQASVAAVAALRETSVIFAALIGSLLLKEPFGRDRVTGACIVVIGIAIMKL
jgi:drug/metabolite transporter (DMT)-like permease